MPLAQLDRASDYGSEGRGFKSSAARHNGIKNLRGAISFVRVFYFFAGRYSVKIQRNERDLRKIFFR